jgi:ribonuclease P protein component
MYTFKKSERLSSKKLIDQLFKEGHSFYIAPFKVTWLEAEHGGEFPAQVLVGAGRKSFRLAVSRNRVKRQIREIYRLNKVKFYEFLNSRHKQCIFAIIYTGSTPVPFEVAEKKMIALLDRLIEEYKKHSDHPDKTR